MKDPENFTAMEDYRVKLQLPGFGHSNRDSSLVFQARGQTHQLSPRRPRTAEQNRPQASEGPSMAQRSPKCML